MTCVHCTCGLNILFFTSVETHKLPKHRHAAHTSNDLSATLTLNRIQLGKRRSNRMALHSSVGLSGEDRQKSSFTMPARATNLNRHGAAVQLHRELVVGSVVVVRNKLGTQVSARIVSQLAAREGVPTYAIEFVEQDDAASSFWGIAFPPKS